MLVFLPAPFVTLSNSIPGILDAVPPTPVGLKQPVLLIPLTAVSTKPGQDQWATSKDAADNFGQDGRIRDIGRGHVNRP